MGVQNDVKNEGLAFEMALTGKKKDDTDDMTIDEMKDEIKGMIDDTVDMYVGRSTVSSDK